MIRFITYILVLVLSVAASFAQIKSEEIIISNGRILLPGTLTYTNGKSPLIIWVHGSGGVNRDGNQPLYIKQFRDEINKKGISFFSYDKRTANPSNINYLKTNGVDFSDFVDDVKKVVNHFKDDKRFSEIILIGHSQGSLIAMLALDNVSKYISLAGAGETIDKTIIRQVTKQSADLGKLSESYFKELNETGTIKEVNPFLMSLFAKQNQPFMASWMKINPVDEIKKVSIPTLIINGDKDLQVQIKDAENLHKAKPDAELVIIKNMNHVLKHIEKNEDNMKSYMNSDFSVSKELIDVVAKFIIKN